MLDLFPMYLLFGLSVGLTLSFISWVCHIVIDSFKKFF